MATATERAKAPSAATGSPTARRLAEDRFNGGDTVGSDKGGRRHAGRAESPLEVKRAHGAWWNIRKILASLHVTLKLKVAGACVLWKHLLPEELRAKG